MGEGLSSGVALRTALGHASEVTGPVGGFSCLPGVVMASLSELLTQLMSVEHCRPSLGETSWTVVTGRVSRDSDVACSWKSMAGRRDSCCLLSKKWVFSREVTKVPAYSATWRISCSFVQWDPQLAHRHGIANWPMDSSTVTGQ
ncbi:hypothetical protein CSUI_002300 [Cystoisospora suis]|uniref:Uncharacterized protein n=1 Tax=Cystoisospora suis TaxID=483139 RepID=A0A2C6L9U4_9APIC|nr:hypothetical protein CSUI_002300 [Cystoisospora suis]